MSSSRRMLIILGTGILIILGTGIVAIIAIFAIAQVQSDDNDDDGAGGISTASTTEKPATDDADTENGDAANDGRDNDSSADASDSTTTAPTDEATTTTAAGTTTTMGASANCGNAAAVAELIYGRWVAGDKAGAAGCATSAAIDELFAIAVPTDVSFADCGPGGGSGETICAYNHATGVVNVVVVGPDGSGNHKMVDVYEGSAG